jgi:hypothetical protein
MALRDKARKYREAAAAERPDDPRLKVMADEFQSPGNPGATAAFRPNGQS